MLILGEAPTVHHREVTALRLLRLSRLSSQEQEEVRGKTNELLFYLPPKRFALPDENAAIVSALVRLHIDAIDRGPALGVLEDAEMRVLGERIIRFYSFDARIFVERQIRELATRPLGRE